MEGLREILPKDKRRRPIGIAPGSLVEVRPHSVSTVILTKTLDILFLCIISCSQKTIGSHCPRLLASIHV